VIEPGVMKISSTNAEQEEAIEEIEVGYNGPGVDIGFNVTYLLDVLNNLKCDQVNIALGDSTSSALITVPQQDGFKYVVMPMRI
jgi:DNA polymerase-3 subunit beta